jgi:hypothetical protein
MRTRRKVKGERKSGSLELHHAPLTRGKAKARGIPLGMTGCVQTGAGEGGWLQFGLVCVTQSGRQRLITRLWEWTGADSKSSLAETFSQIAQ